MFSFITNIALTAKKRLAFMAAALLLGINNMAWAKGATGPLPTSSMSQPLAITLVIIILVLALIIGLLAHILLGAADIQRQQDKNASIPTAVVITGILTILSAPAMAQDAATSVTAAAKTIGGLEYTPFFMLVGVIFIELMVILYLLYNLYWLLKKEKIALAPTAALTGEPVTPVAPVLNWWDKFNRFKPVEEEVDIDLGHNYDGIRELDNKLPPWWLYGFYCCIIFAGIYLWRFHVSHSAPSSKEEYEFAMARAEEQKEEYLKKAGNKIDENNVVLLKGDDIEAGKASFITNCAPCHGKLGEGTVGPNLTDEYWIHGGSIKDIFKTIKYGFPEKGMRSWKEEINPKQMAQLSSFILSLKGTNPPNAKEKQGELYTDAVAPVKDSLRVAKDSVAPAATTK